MAEKSTTAMTSQKDASVASMRRSEGPWHRFADEMDRAFNNMFSRTWGARWKGRGWDLWAPEIEVFRRGSELIVRADLPGLQKDEVNVNITDNALVIQGERHHEHEEEREGMYHSERTYGNFYRSIPLPEGAMSDQAKATFRNGVLEITMPAPSEQVTRGRRLEIAEGK